MGMNADANIIRAIDMRIDQRLKKTFFEGVIVNATKGHAQVQIAGSTALQSAYYTPSMSVEPGLRCLLAYLPVQNRIAIITTFGSSGGATPRLPPNVELSPPSGLTSQPILPGIALATWNAPYQHSVLFEVQANDSPTSVDAVTVLYTRGSYAMIPTESNIFVRVRSITQHPSYSSWTEWVELEPGTGSSGGGEFDGDASDVPFTSDFHWLWSPSVDNVHDALDQLIDRMFYVEQEVYAPDDPLQHRLSNRYYS